jgi:glucosamine-6-phosphate deaminase
MLNECEVFRVNPNPEVRKHQIDRLKIAIYPERSAMGQAAAAAVAERIRALAARQDAIRMIFAAAPSQNEFLQALVETDGLPWAKVTAFHMDEYIGLAPGAPQRFGEFLRTRLFDRVPFGRIHYLNPAAGEAAQECARYASLLAAAPIDIICMGIGENGHIAFNDPPVADFNDPRAVKVVDLDPVCRQQQVNDSCFASLNEVPKQAVTLTVPTLAAGKSLFIIVPGTTKSKAVHDTLLGEIGTPCPASILRTHPDAVLYLDIDSAAALA